MRPSIADYAGAAIDVLDALGIERATVIGHHFFKQWTVAPDGSHLLEKWTRMHQWLPHPELVQRLVVDLFRAGEASEQGHLAVADYRMEERLPSVRCPALLLFCTRDPFTTPERAEPLRQAFAPCRIASIEAGIFAANEQPERYADAVLDYLRNPP